MRCAGAVNVLMWLCINDYAGDDNDDRNTNTHHGINKNDCDGKLTVRFVWICSVIKKHTKATAKAKAIQYLGFGVRTVTIHK